MMQLLLLINFVREEIIRTRQSRQSCQYKMHSSWLRFDHVAEHFDKM